MSNCPNCNSPLPQGAENCPNCNAPVNQTESNAPVNQVENNAPINQDESNASVNQPENNAPNPQPMDYGTYQQGFNQNSNMYQMPPQEKKANAGLAILSFLIPIAGLIIFLTQKDKKPKTAKASGICALVSFILSMVLSIVAVAATGLLVADSNLDDPSGYFEDYNDEDNNYSDDNVVGGTDSSDNGTTDSGKNDGSSSDKNDGEKTSKANSGSSEAEEFSVGAVENNVYTNKFTNIKYVLPDDDWSFSSYDELLSSTDGAKIDEETGATVIDAGIEKSYFAAVASQATTGTNVQFMIIESKTLLTSKMDAEEYLETTVEAVVPDYETAVKSPDDLTCKIGTDTYSRIDTVYNSQGVDVAQTYLCQKIGDYYSFIIITSAAGSDNSVIDDCIGNISNAK